MKIHNFYRVLNKNCEVQIEKYEANNNQFTDDYEQRRIARKKKMKYMQKVYDNEKLQNKQVENIENVIQQSYRKFRKSYGYK
jgi:hypothetical protein